MSVKLIVAISFIKKLLMIISFAGIVHQDA